MARRRLGRQWTNVTVPSGTVVATGSVAFDYILTFNGRFRDHILPDSVHVLNLSFLVDRFQKRRGGVAANYAYNLRLLGHPAAVLATAGDDAEDYRRWLEDLGIDCRGLRILAGEHTATGFTTTDLDDNQITGYFGGAMNRAAEVGLADTVGDAAAVIVGPNAPAAMERLVQESRGRGLRYVFDPAHQLPHMSGADLTRDAEGAWILIGNDYELRMITERTGRPVEHLLDLCEIVVTTLGREGSRIDARDGAYAIPPAPPRELVDPTGAGDAYRAGLVAALLRDCDLETAGRVASLAATYAVEQPGTIEHRYTLSEFAERYRDAFDAEPPPAFSP
jgi:adenosine kinase